MTQADVVAYISAAKEDGWEVVLEDLYTIRLEKGRFTMCSYKYNEILCGISVFDENQRQIPISNREYSMQHILERESICSFCLCKKVEHNVGFVYKSCNDCFYDAIKKFEYEGWNK